MFSNYEISPDAFKYFKIAYKFQLSGEFENAVINYKKSLVIQETAEAYTFLGWTFSFMGKFDNAIEECHKAIAIDPHFGNPYNDIGSYLIQLGNLDEAIGWLEKAKHAKRYENPEFAYTNLGKIYELKGLWPLAIKEYEKALELNKNYNQAKDALSRLQNNLN